MRLVVTLATADLCGPQPMMDDIRLPDRLANVIPQYADVNLITPGHLSFKVSVSASKEATSL